MHIMEKRRGGLSFGSGSDGLGSVSSGGDGGSGTNSFHIIRRTSSGRVPNCPSGEGGILVRLFMLVDLLASNNSAMWS